MICMYRTQGARVSHRDSRRVGGDGAATLSRLRVAADALAAASSEGRECERWPMQTLAFRL